MKTKSLLRRYRTDIITLVSSLFVVAVIVLAIKFQSKGKERLAGDKQTTQVAISEKSKEVISEKSTQANTITPTNHTPEATVSIGEIIFIAFFVLAGICWIIKLVGFDCEEPLMNRLSASVAILIIVVFFPVSYINGSKESKWKAARQAREDKFLVDHPNFLQDQADANKREREKRKDQRILEDYDRKRQQVIDDAKEIIRRKEVIKKYRGY